MRSQLIGFIAILILLSGCSFGLQQRWTDFNAYFNTFYNARQSYDAGMRSLNNQRFDINAERPIRIHRTPVRAGQADFERAIEKSADILRDHRESRWVDDALELIGKSYFHLGQFFSAEQKFNEVLQTTLNDEFRQRAIYWRGRIYLETNRYSEGITYLNAHLNADEFTWNRQTNLEIHLVLAQLYVQIEEWDLAASHLQTGVDGFRDEIIRSRAAFLHGQILERIQQPEAAKQAYAQVSRRYPEYQLLYLAELRRNQLLRETGQHDRALRNFIAMSRDDKNFDNLSRIEFEIGRTLQAKGEADQAFIIFNNVLYNSIQNPARETIAKVHYAKAELYRFAYGDFTMAALHYDSSSRSATDLTRMPERFDAAALATSFGEYARLSTAISKRDSLLHLGTLPMDQLEERILSIRDQRLREFERQQRQDQLRGTTVVTIPGQQTEQTQEQTRDNGFLNHRNPQLVAQASESFAALWNSRPLVDNWRRQEAVRSAVIAMEAGELESDESTVDAGMQSGLAQVAIPAELEINLEEIPLTETDQLAVRMEIARLEYELGNVFYLNLNMPDSALFHYIRVVEEFPESEVRPQAMYSIADIYLLHNNLDTATEWGRAIIKEFPGTTVASRIASRLNLDLPQIERVITDDEKAENDFLTLVATLSSGDAQTRIHEFEAFISRHPESNRVADALFNRALAYAEIGRTDVVFRQRFQEREQLRTEWEEMQSAFRASQDEAREALMDTTLTDTLHAFYESILDSTLTAPDFDKLFPFVGSPWDSTRAVLTRITSEFSSSRFVDRSTAMLQVIQLPASMMETENGDVEIREFPQTLPEGVAAEFVECNMLDQPLEFFTTNEAFLDANGFYGAMREQGVFSADFEFDITVDHTGKVTRVVSLIEEDPVGLTTKLRDLLRNEGRFSVPASRGVPVQTTCYYSVSIDL